MFEVKRFGRRKRMTDYERIDEFITNSEVKFTFDVYNRAGVLLKVDIFSEC